MAIRTNARPRLKLVRSASPKPMRPRAMALRRRTRAEGQGTMPPLTASPVRLEKVTSPSGWWV